MKRLLLVVTAASALLAGSLAERGIARIPANGALFGLDIFDFLLVDQDLPAAIVQLLLGIFGAVLALRMGDPARVLERVASRPRTVAGVTVVVALSISVFAFHRYPLALDEYAPVFQARVFAAGHTVATVRPELIPWLFFPAFVPTFFTASVRAGQVVSSYWPGFALLLAPFEAVKLGFLLNPLLAGGSVLLVRRAALELTSGDRDAAGWATALLVVSPVFLITAASFYSMNAHLFANLAFLVLVLRPTPRRLLAAGFLGGWALALHQPLPHVAFAVPVFLHLLRGPEGRVRRFLTLGAGYVPSTLLLVGGWHLLRLRLLTTDVPGAAAVQLSGAFSFPTAEMLELRWVGFGKLAVWAPFGLVPLAVLGAFRRRDQPTTQLLLATVVSTLGAYTFVRFSQGHGWGNRYFHSAYGSLVLLAALGLSSLSRSSAEESAASPGVRVRAAAAAWVLMALFVLVPQRVYQVHDFVTAELAQLVDTSKLDGAYVSIVRAGPPGYYVQDLIRNDPALHGTSLMVASHGRRADEAFLARVLPGASLYASLPNEMVFRGVGLAGVDPEGAR